MQRYALTVLIAFALSLAAVAAPAAADTVFQAGFEYTTEPTVGNDAANLNTGMIGLIGSFSGAVPDASGTGDDADELITFDDGPAGTRLMKLDRGVADGVLTANLDETVFLDGASVSFDLATRRTAPDRNKDYDIVGYNAGGSESFHLRVIADSDLARLAVVTGGSTETYELISTFGGTGSDTNGSLPFTSPDPTNASQIASIALALGSTGYTIDFARNNGAYTTGVIPYNGAAGGLSRIEFQYRGGDNDNVRTGFFLDNLAVEGTLIPTPAALPAGLMLMALIALRSQRRI